MATYRAIAASEVDADSPVTATLVSALAENPTAIAEGAAGAPRIKYLAGTVGSLLFGTGPNAAYGAVVAGSMLKPSGAIHSVINLGAFTGAFVEGAAQAGSWQCLGVRDNLGFSGTGTPVLPATLWQRLA
jgi:hypothetical protein